MFSAISNLFGYLLNFLYELVNNYGIAIILFSILLRIILLPLTIKQQISMEKTTKIQGELKALQFKYKNNPEMLNKETMALYKREKISPFGGCLNAFIPIIIILSVFWLVSQPLTYMKKANKNPELNSVVEEYKNKINESNSKKQSYIEIAVISKIEEDYKNIDKQLSENTSYNNENLIQENNENIENNEVVENNEQNQLDNTENDNANENTTETREKLESRKSLLEKLRINMDFCGLDLSKVPKNNYKDIKVFIIPILYVISSFVSIKISTSMQNKKKKEETKKTNEDGKEDPTEAMAEMTKSMSYIMPIMTISISFIAPLGMALYWFVSNVLMIVERIVIKKVVSAKEG